MKRGGKLLCLLAALVVLIGAYFLAGNVTSKRTAAAEAAEETVTVDISRLAAEDAVSLSWTGSGTDVSLEKRDDTWVSTDDEACPIDQSLVDGMVDTLAALTATGCYDEPDELEEYGLDTPCLTVTVSDGTTETSYLLGNTSALTGEYYLLIDGETPVYTVDSVLYGTFEEDLDSLAEWEVLPTDIDTVQSFVFDTDGVSAQLVYIPDSAELYYTDAYDWFLSEDGSYTPLSTTAVTTLYQLVTNITWNSCVTWDAGAAELTQYGFDTPQGRAVLTYTDYEGAEGEVVLLFGAYADSGVYTMLEGSDMIYITDGSALDGLMFADLTALQPTEVCCIDPDALESLELAVYDTPYVITVTQTPVEETDIESDDETGSETDTETAASADELTTEDAEQTEAAEELPVRTYALDDGTELDAEAAEAWVEALCDLTADSVAPQAQPRSELLSVTFHTTDGADGMTLTVYDYDSSSCVAIFAERTMLVSRSEVLNLVSAISALTEAQ